MRACVCEYVLCRLCAISHTLLCGWLANLIASLKYILILILVVAARNCSIRWESDRQTSLKNKISGEWRCKPIIVGWTKNQ